MNDKEAYEKFRDLFAFVEHIEETLWAYIECKEAYIQWQDGLITEAEFHDKAGSLLGKNVDEALKDE